MWAGRSGLCFLENPDWGNDADAQEWDMESTWAFHPSVPMVYMLDGLGGWANQFPLLPTWSMFWLSYIKLCFLNPRLFLRSLRPEIVVHISLFHMALTSWAHRRCSGSLLDPPDGASTVGWAPGWTCGISGMFYLPLGIVNSEIVTCTIYLFKHLF